MGILPEEDEKRFFSELSFQFGKTRQSLTTNLIHFSYEDYLSWDCIPLYENFCFLLALFRTHKMENILEAKKLLDRLLSFQIKRGENKGSFPTYLHEFPMPSQSKKSFLIFIPLFWIYQKYAHILDVHLKEKLKKSLYLLLDYVQKNRGVIKTKGMQTLIESISFSLGVSLGLCRETIFHIDFLKICANEASQLLLASQILELKEPETSKFIYERLFTLWSKSQKVFVGSLLFEKQKAGQPQTSLIDYFMEHYYKTYSLRTQRPDPLQLQTSLLFPIQKEIKKISKENGDHLCWSVKETSSYLFHFFPFHKPCPSLFPLSGFHLFRLIWNEEGKVQSLVCQEAKHLVEVIEKEEGYWEMHFSFLDQEIEDSFELSFFLSYQPEIEIFVENEKASMFFLGDTLNIRSKVLLISLQFELLGEEGKFIGHIFRSTRKSEIAAEEASSFDWKIALRTLSRQRALTLVASLRIKSMN